MAITIDADGITTDTQEQIQASILARLRARFGGSLNTQITSLSGQFAAVVAEGLALNQQATLALARSFDPAAAQGRLLDQRAALTGSTRKGATHSQVRGVLTASAPCVVADGTLFANDEFGGTWEVTGGPYVFAGAGSLDATLVAVETGPVNAQAGNTWSSVTIISGLTGFTNPVDDASLGRVQEGDPEFRYRRTAELYARGQGPLAAVAAVVGRVDGVVSCRVFHNPSESPVGTDPVRNLGIPWKAGNVVVETEPAIPGADLQQAIADAAWSAAGLGVELYGTSYTRTVADAEGQSHTVSFDVVADVDVFLNVVLTTSASDGPIIPLDPLIMATLIRTKCLARAAELRFAGRDFRALDYVGAITSLITLGELSGVSSLECTVSDDGATWVQSVPITLRQRADFDTGEFTCTINGVLIL